RDGSYRWFSGRAEPLRNEDGALIGWIGAWTDIDARKQAEAAARTEADTLEVINRVGQAVSAELHLDRLVQAVTDAATGLTGAQFGAFFYNVTDDAGESYSLYTISGVPSEHFSHFPLPRNTHLFGPTFRGEGIVRVANVRQDPRFGRNHPHYGMPAGHLPVTSYLAVPVVSRDGDVLGGLFFGHEREGVFTERHERIIVGLAAQAAVAMDNARLYQRSRHSEATLEARVRERTRELEERTEEQTTFIYTVSHDLRTPLLAMQGMTELLVEAAVGGDREEAAFLARRVLANVGKMGALLDDLLVLSRVGRSEEAAARLDLGRVVRDTADELHGRARALSAELRLPADWPAVLLPATEAAQLVTNLLSNAVKWAGRDPGQSTAERPARRPEVTVEWRNEGGMVLLRVSDNGPGIAPQHRDRVFDLFRKLDPKAEGTGVGLAIVKRIVERHGGRAWVEESAAGGAALNVTLLEAP
ncbi:MAG TPA: ATP-binding protein, partial [Deinococcales bacterium]|nr:ATP-binding protein [Deinococcales bacterium]